MESAQLEGNCQNDPGDSGAPNAIKHESDMARSGS